MKPFKLTLLILIVLIAVFKSVEAQNGVLLNTPPTQRPVKPTISLNDYKANADGWLVDIEKAYELSKKTGKPIMANFTGSDWCGWCKKLKREVFDKPEFIAWAKKNVVLVELDFPRRFEIPESIKQQNYSLAKAFNVTGYPTIWVFNLSKDEKGEFKISALGKTGYVAGGPQNFENGVNEMFKRAAEN